MSKLKSMSRVVVLLALGGLFVSGFPADVHGRFSLIGTIKSTFPPGNNGTHKGAGQIVENGTGNVFVFQTPDDLDTKGMPIKVGERVTFENPRGHQATHIAVWSGK